jgi:hypothetical protein
VARDTRTVYREILAFIVSPDANTKSRCALQVSPAVVFFPQWEQYALVSGEWLLPGGHSHARQVAQAAGGEDEGVIGQAKRR